MKKILPDLDGGVNENNGDGVLRSGLLRKALVCHFHPFSYTSFAVL